MTIIRPRLNDFHNIHLVQEEVDFAIPFLDEDIPLYVDPFLLWKVNSLQDNALHTAIVTSFNALGHQFSKGNRSDSVQMLIHLSECAEVGFGNSKSRVGKRIGEKNANDILELFVNIPQISRNGFQHFEEIQLLVDNISKDRISDISCSIIKSFLIDYTIDQCRNIGIPVEPSSINLFNYKKQRIVDETVPLPVNPITKAPILLVPKRWLKFIPWINFDDYYKHHYIPEDHVKKLDRVQVLNFNRENYDIINQYTELRKKASNDCKNDPLFNQVPILSAKRKLKSVMGLQTGKTENADKVYEDILVQLLSSMLYPHLDFAKDQSRIESGSQIRDLIFYNNRSYNFLQEIYDTFDSKQIVIELKNVNKIEREHINQMNRYLTEQFGRFGIIFTRNKVPKPMYQNTIDLWSGQRRCILILDDTDLQMMVDIYESKQRLPIEVIKKKYVEFMRSCPA